MMKQLIYSNQKGSWHSILSF